MRPIGAVRPFENLTGLNGVAYCRLQMTDRASQSKGAKTAVVTETRTQTKIDGEEDKVVRMRQGYAAPDSLELEQRGQGNPDVAAQLRGIELRALEMSGRLDELRAEVGLENPPADASIKSKIIEQLAAKGSSDS